MARQRLDSSPSATASAPFVTGLALALGVFGACTTEDPREHFRTMTDVRTLGSNGGSSGRSGSSSGSIGGGASRGGSQGSSGTGAASGSGGRGATNASGGDSGEVSTGAEDGHGGEAGAGNGSGANGGTETNGSGGSGTAGTAGTDVGPLDTCGERPVTTGPFLRQSLLAAAADCAVWHYCKFEASATRLEASTAAHVAERTPASLERAQADWRTAVATWSAVELFQFGPLASRAESEGKDIVHGEGLREFVYSWPRFTRCRVEEQVATEAYATLGFPNVPLAGRGLYGLEYLLFYGGSDSACGAGTSAATAWAALDASELTEHKHRYATALIADVLATTRTLLARWSPSGGNFRNTFVNAVGYEDEQQALTILAWSLVYLEREVKDWKLGVPLGVTLTHPVTGPEAPFARVGTDNIRQNLRGFRALFQGCGPNGEGLGFDDWLSEAGHAELGQDIVGALDAADTFTSTFPPLETATEDELSALYMTIKTVTNYLKSDLFGSQSPLNLELPLGVQGDTD